MTKLLKLLLVMLTLTQLVGCMNMAVSGASAVYNQHSIRKKFKDNYTTYKSYRAINNEKRTFKDTNISVTTFNSQVLLTGQVPFSWQRERAEQIVKQFAYVDHVYNLISIANPSSFLTRVSDTWLTAKIKSKLIASEEVDATQIKVVSENGTVYLMGVVPPKEAEEAVRLAKETYGVESVVKIFYYVQITRTA